MAKILVFTNPLDVSDCKSYTFNGPYIDWLQEHYPNGFHGNHISVLNSQKLNIENYDINLTKDDILLLGILPGIEAAVLIQIIVGILISTALNLIANAIFGSDFNLDKLKSLPNPSPTYSLTVPTNQARLGQPIPVIYGTVISIPDLASVAYTWFEDNEMYAGILLCLGQGWHSILDVRVADTPVNQLAAGTLYYNVFPPDVHNKEFGYITSVMNTGGATTRFYENVHTSPEVADQELDRETRDDDDEDGQCYWVYTNSINCEESKFVVEGLLNKPLLECYGQDIPLPNALPDCIAVGQTVTISNSNVNDGVYTILAFDEYTGTYPNVYTNGGWVQLSPALQCEDAGITFISQEGTIFEPSCVVGCKITIRLFECETGSFVDMTCSTHPISSSNVGDAITISWSEWIVYPFSQANFVLTGMVESVSRISTFLTQYVDISIINYTLEDGVEGSIVSPVYCPYEEHPDCQIVGPITVNIVSPGQEPLITYSCGGGAGEEPNTCGPLGIGPFTTPNPGWTTDLLSLDVQFPSGLYTVSEEGDLANETVTIEWTATEVDDNGFVIGPSHTRTDSITRASNTPQRITFWWDLPKARYSVCARRTSLKSSKAQNQSRVLWTGLKAILDSKNKPVYNNTTIIAIKAKATNGLATDALNRFSVKCTREVPDFLDSETMPLLATSSYAHIFCDIFHNSWYGANRPLTEIDLDDLGVIYLKTNCLSGFNAVFDSRITIWEALSLCMAPVHAYPATNGSIITAIIDGPQEISTHCFNESNIIKNSVQLSYVFDDAGTPDGVEIEYRDPVNFAQAYEIYPEESVEPESITLFGCTNQIEAQKYAQRSWRQKLYRREFIKFSSELEGHLPLIGETISVEHRLLDGPTCYVITSITPAEEFQFTIEAFKYKSEVYSYVLPDKTINLNARYHVVLTDSDDIPGDGYLNGITISGYKTSDVLLLSLPSAETFISWSPFGLPAYDPNYPNSSGSTNHFCVLKGEDATSYEMLGNSGGLGDGGAYYNGYEAARAGFVETTITGFTQYTFFILDGLIEDNTGGLSIKVQVQ